MIKEVLQRYYPSWDPPEDDYRTWIPTECPVHGDENASASVSYEHDAFKCHACGYSGDYLKIIEREEECGFAEALEIATRIATESGNDLPFKAGRKSGRRVPKLPKFGSFTS